jgi:hypothetical protein
MFLFPASLWAWAEAPVAGLIGNRFWVTLGSTVGAAGGVAWPIAMLMEQCWDDRERLSG